jgi:molecular chaperone HtpG
MKEVLGDEVEKVVISNRLDSSPCVLVTNEYGMTANMQRIMKAQALSSKDNYMMMMNKKTLEINPYNKMIMRIKERLESDESGADSKMLKDLVHLIYDVTLQSSGFSLEDPSTFSKRILKVINIGLGVDDDEDDEDDISNNQSLETENNISTQTMEEVD